MLLIDEVIMISVSSCMIYLNYFKLLSPFARLKNMSVNTFVHRQIHIIYIYTYIYHIDRNGVIHVYMSNFLLSILQTTSSAVSLEFLIARCS